MLTIVLLAATALLSPTSVVITEDIRYVKLCVELANKDKIQRTLNVGINSIDGSAQGMMFL